MKDIRHRVYSFALILQIEKICCLQSLFMSIWSSWFFNYYSILSCKELITVHAFKEVLPIKKKLYLKLIMEVIFTSDEKYFKLLKETIKTTQISWYLYLETVCSQFTHFSKF